MAGAALYAIPSHAVKPENLPPSPAATILLVEDEASVRKVTSLMLLRNGFEVLQAADPASALEICANPHLKIDVLVTDVVMPGTNGKELALQIRRQRPNLKVLFMSGYTGYPESLGAELPPSSAFIGKPYSWKDFLATLRTIMESENAAGSCL